MVETQVRTEQLRLLYEHGAIAIIVNGLVAVLLVTLVGSSVPHHDLVAWCAFFASTWFVRLTLHLAHWRAPSLVSERAWLVLFAIATFVAGTAWGVTAIWLFPNVLEVRFFVAIAVIGLAAGAVPALSSVRGMYALYVFPAVLPIAIRFAAEDASRPYAIVALALLYCVGMSIASRLNNRLLSGALRLRFKNAELVGQLETLATRDALTGLPNRLSVVDRLNAALRRARRTNEPLAVVFADCDGFKEINDTYGHSAGDEYLRRVAFALEKAVRETDTVARLGGDEFVVLLESCGDREAIETIVERMCERAMQPCVIGEATIIPRLSIGIARYPHDGATSDALLQRADQAMYAAKREGGNSVHFYARSVLRGSI